MVDNLKDFTNNWIMFGLLFFMMMSFTIYFFAYNGTEGLGDSESKFTDAQSSVQSKLIDVENESNILMNISAQTDPQVSQLGSSDSVATSYKLTGTSKGMWESSKVFIKWILTGTTGEILISIFSGMILISSIYFITKWIRAGF